MSVVLLENSWIDWGDTEFVILGRVRVVGAKVSGTVDSVPP